MKSKSGVSAENVAIITFNDIPVVNHTFKYDVLGRLALENHRTYCDRHGYAFISDVEVARDRPACWAKIPAILAAFESYSWVLWSDSDTLVLTPERPIHDLCDDDFDMIVQSHDAYFQLLGVPRQQGLDRMPINTGVFMLRASVWSRSFLQRAYARTEFVSGVHGVWDGIGEQEAMIALLREAPQDRSRIAYVDSLQNHPRLWRPGDRFAHFYGNHAKHRIPLEACDEVLGRWSRAIHASTTLPPDRARFHWCCIQNKRRDAPIVQGDLSRYLYREEDIMPGSMQDT